MVAPISVTPDTDVRSLPAAHWDAFSGLLDEAFDLPLDQREAWLAHLPHEHEHLRAALTQVLAADQASAADSFLDELSCSDAIEPAPVFAADQQVGPYRLLAPLGRGGMGEVWSAERADGSLKRRVALKLPHAWLFAAATRLRLIRERDILASLTHPHIARLYDAGIAADGQPWLAMELIEGRALDVHCREARLGVTDRLALFAQLAQAVSFAHARLVVHRDLKPTNILVTAQGEVKLLDFGIAKLLDETGGGHDTEITRLGGRVATPDYAAPEQLTGESITVGTDVFGLGVVLFELLTGARPFAGKTRKSDPLAHAPLASASIAADHAGPSGALKKAILGDLDAILAKALAPRPADRYASVEALAEDLRRSLRFEPIRARRITRFERARRFVRRYRRPVIFASLLAGSVLVGAIGIAWQAREAAAAARLARAEAAKAVASKDFLVDVFRASDRSLASDISPGTISARQLLDRSVDRIDSEFADHPDLRLELLGVTAQIYSQWGERDRFLAMTERRRTLARQTLGDAHPLVIETLLDEALQFTPPDDDPERCARLLDEADRLIRQAGLDPSRLRARWWWLIAKRDVGIPDAAPKRIVALENAIALFERHAPDDPARAFSLEFLAEEHHDAGRDERARDLVEQAIAAYLALPPKQRNDSAIAFVHGSHARYLERLGDVQGVDAAYLRSLALHRQTFGESHPYYWMYAALHAEFVHRQGQTARAQRMFETLLASVAKGEEDTTYRTDVRVRRMYASCLVAEGHYLQALPLLEQSRAVYEQEAGNEIELARTRLALGQAYAHIDRHDEARVFLRSAWEGFLAQTGPASQDTLHARARWAEFLLDRGEVEPAAAEFRAVAETAAAPISIGVAEAQAGLARIALMRDEIASALQWSGAAAATLDRVRALYDLRLRPPIWQVRADTLARSGDAVAAQRWRQRALDARRSFAEGS
ncbi:MAG: protein kinase domain-containing protein [Panacagrimonas sp.]